MTTVTDADFELVAQTWLQRVRWQTARWPGLT